MAYTLDRVREMLGVSRTVLSALIASGIVAPVREPQNRRRYFSFEDLTLLRTAGRLQKAGVRPRNILRALERLKLTLPKEASLTGLRLSAIGRDVAVRDNHGRLQASTGQWLMAFDAEPVGGSVRVLPASPRNLPRATAFNAFDHGEALEAQAQIAQAEAAYRAAVAADSADIRPYLNLGALLCEADRCGEAVALYQDALAEHGAEPVLHFNHAVALEGDARPAEALLSYRQALALDPGLADAHYNIAVLLQVEGDQQGAIRHLSAYRRLQGNGAD